MIKQKAPLRELKRQGLVVLLLLLLLLLLLEKRQGLVVQIITHLFWVRQQ